MTTTADRLTPQQVALLRDVHAGDVVQGPDDYGYVWAWRINPPFTPRKVDFSMRRLQQRGYVDLVEMRWRLTKAGKTAIGATP
jgi:hypothetical protein